MLLPRGPRLRHAEPTPLRLRTGAQVVARGALGRGLCLGRALRRGRGRDRRPDPKGMGFFVSHVPEHPQALPAAVLVARAYDPRALSRMALFRAFGPRGA